MVDVCLWPNRESLTTFMISERKDALLQGNLSDIFYFFGLIFSRPVVFHWLCMISDLATLLLDTYTWSDESHTVLELLQDFIPTPKAQRRDIVLWNSTWPLKPFPFQWQLSSLEWHSNSGRKKNKNLSSFIDKFMEGHAEKTQRCLDLFSISISSLNKNYI